MLLLTTVLFYNIKCILSQSNYTLFRNQVCNGSNEYYSSCACGLAYFTTEEASEFDCWDDFSCYYNIETNEFCNTHGYCDYSQSKCVCDLEWEGDDCSKLNLYELPLGVTISIIASASIVLICSVGLMVFIYNHRHQPTIRATSGRFTHLELIGCVLICAGAVVIGIGFNDVNCVVLEWFQFVGISMVISCALLKAYRIVKIFSMRVLKVRTITDTRLLIYSCIIMAISVIILVLYTYFSFIEGGCLNGTSSMISYLLLVAWQLILVLFLLIYGYKAANVSFKQAAKFKETKCIYIGSMAGLVILVIIVICIFVTPMHIAIRGYGSLIFVLIVILLQFRRIKQAQAPTKKKRLKRLLTAVNSEFKAGTLELADEDYIEEIEKSKIFIKITMRLSQKISVESVVKNADDLTQILFSQIEDIGVDNVKNVKVTGATSVNSKTLYIDFECQFQNLNCVSYQLRRISPHLAMETAIQEALIDNNEFYQNVINSFTIAGIYSPSSISTKVMKINDISIQQTTDDSIKEILTKRYISSRDQQKKLIVLENKPLHLFTKLDVCDIIKCWVMNDFNHIKRTQLFMDIAIKNRFSGIEISKMKKHLKTVLQKEILPYMSPDSFNNIYLHLETWIKKGSVEELLMKRAPDVALLMSDYALDELCKHVFEKNINGESIIYFNSNNDVSWIKGSSGWSDHDIKQINSILLKQKTNEASIIQKNLYTKLQNKFGRIIASRLCDDISNNGLDLEKLQLNIKRGATIDIESEVVMDLIKEIEEKNDDKNFISDIYQIIGQCLMIDDNWVCCNCGNYNFNHYIGGAMNMDLEICRLCGIDHLFSIINVLKSNDTYIMAVLHNKISNSGNDDKFNHKTSDAEQFEEDEMKENASITIVNEESQYNLIEMQDMRGLEFIENDFVIITDFKINDYNDKIGQILRVSNNNNHIRNVKIIENGKDLLIAAKNLIPYKPAINILCPNTFHNEYCESLIRLCERIKYYQYWINKIKKEKGNIDITTTTKVDISKLDNEIFKEIIINSIPLLPEKRKLNNNEITLLQNLLDDNIININKYSSLNLSKFLKLIFNKTNIKQGRLIPLFRIAKPLLKNKAQTYEFGKFFTEIELSKFDNDYHHIINVHIKNGDKSTKENVFRYFQNNVDCDDADCSSLLRNQQRINEINNEQIGIKKVINSDRNKDEDKHIWTKKQYYVQSQLDIIHAYFVHHNWKNDIALNDNELEEFGEEEEEEEEKDEEKQIEQKYNDVSSKTKGNKGKYVSDASQYGFGVDHDYSYLLPVYQCLRDEIIKSITLNIESFERLLIKAINKHKIAITQYQLRCTHFDPEYNINRNEQIGVRHILAICLYTDCSTFCTTFRESYRKLSLNETEHDVTKRHCKMYWVGRFLFECIEFFGEEMNDSMTIYHGLNTVMMFERFTAYFNQPISTTKSFRIAKQFANTRGAILTFKRAVSMDDNLIPRFMDVSWMSAFPNEDERLFYGRNIAFEIFDIREVTMPTNTNKMYLKIFNIFQKLFKNQEIKWDKISCKIRTTMIEMINRKKNANKKKTKLSDKLFKYFCDNKSSSKWICIRNFESIPSKLKISLFGMDSISFIGLTQLFPPCKEILLNNVNLKIMTNKSKNYIESIMKYIKYINKNKINNNLYSITFESEEEMNGKPNSTLKRYSKQYNTKFKQNKINWDIKYEFKVERNHILTFIPTN